MTFEVDQWELDDDHASEPELEHAGLLRHTYFQMPVTIEVAGVEVFRQKTGIFYMATRGREVVESLRDGKKAELIPPMGGKLTFEVEGDSVLITTLGAISVSADLVDLKDAWRRFAHEVKTFLVTEFPRLKDNRQVGSWFRDEEL